MTKQKGKEQVDLEQPINNMITITIDGLSTNGKSTLANLIAKKYGFKSFNTGAIYRVIALTIIRKNLDIFNIEKVLFSIKNMKVDFRNESVFLNGEDVTELIKSEEISRLSTEWGTILELKRFVRKYQKNFIKKNNVIMEGRDIGTRIAPDANIKFYLYSDFEIRVERKWKQNTSINKEEIRKNLLLLDDLDINHGNFIKPSNAISINTSNYTIEELYKKMTTIIDHKLEKFNKINNEEKIR